MMPNPGHGRPTLPLGFLGVGVLSLVLLGPVLLLGWQEMSIYWFRNPWALLATHLFTLGFATPVIYGAMYQLVPVLAEAPLHSNRHGLVHLGLHLAGLVLILPGFWFLSVPLLVAGGSLVVGGALLFTWNMSWTLKAARKWHPTLTFIAGALFYLNLVTMLGLVLAFNFQLGFLGASIRSHVIYHAILGFGGWFTLTILGVAFRLVPLFTLSHATPGRIYWVFGLTNAGLWLSMWHGALGLLVFVSGLALFLFEMGKVIRSRVRRKIDVSVRYGLGGLAWLLAGLLMLAILLFDPDQHAARGLAALYSIGMGWVALLMTGHLYKIGAFLVWTYRFANRAGRERVPALKDMYNERPAGWVHIALHAGCVLVVTGLWFGSLPVTLGGGVVTTAATTWFGWLFGQMLLMGGADRGQRVGGLGTAKESH